MAALFDLQNSNDTQMEVNLLPRERFIHRIKASPALNVGKGK